MADIKFTETALRTQNKKGVLTPDENGYYTLVIGGLNCYNSAGEYYVSKGATDLFTSSSHLMRRIATGQLRGEQGHPRKLPNMSTSQWVNRIMTIDEACVCSHFAEIWLDLNYGRNNPGCGNPELIAIMGRVKPSGPYGDALKASLDNPEENVAFSIRSLTENETINGRVEKTLSQIITWDYVIEPGINIANKWSTPTLEDISRDIITREMIVTVANESINSRFAIEESRAIYQEALDKFSSPIKDNKTNKLFTWR